MPVRNQNFYNLQESRRYPLDDTATGTDDDGARLQDNILVDCYLRFPEAAGKFAYVGGITVTANLVTVTFLAADAPDASPTSFTPLAAVTLVKPVVEGRQYPVEALYPGTGGWVTFGGGILEAFVARFSSPQQALVAHRCARWYRTLPIPSIGKLFRATALTGLVTIKGGTDVAVVKETVEIEGLEREALVFRLTQEIPARNTLAEFVGPCSTRPESNNCEKPGVEFVNDVGPDCAGNLEIEFIGVATGPYDDCGPGITVDHELGLGDACQPSIISVEPRYTDSCMSVSSVSESSTAEEEPEESSVSDSAGEEPEEVPCGELPYCANFDAQTAVEFTVKSGAFIYEAYDSPSETCGGVSESVGEISISSGVSLIDYDTSDPDYSYVATAGYGRNISVYNDCSYTSSLEKRAFVDLQLTGNNPDRNGGIAINYHITNPLTIPRVEYFLALLDHNRSTLRLLRFNGSGYITEFETDNLPVLLSEWYRLRVTVTAIDDEQVAIAVQISGITDLAFPTTSFTVVTTQFGEDDGLYGVGSNNGYTRFSYFSLAEFP